MRCLLPVTVYCISLFTLQQLLALPLANRPQRSLDILLGRPSQQLEGTKVREEDAPSSSSSAPSSDGVHDADSVHPTLSPASLWRVLLVKGAPLTETGVVAVTDNLPSPIADTDIMEPKRRGRRQVNGGSRGHHPHLHGHPQLMRVGCVLGTCQVQNLSHRLYQLNGQMGRDDSSPINPRSPHSYG
ncbi:protein ADM2a [Engraulis encrasicolus]|uniref:protein ADM2a n=1 Tax=Engraulis encrasicolus TaxID=184585 RepID=UPI002FCF3213